MLLLQPGAFRGRDVGGQRRALRGQPGRGQPGFGPPAPPAASGRRGPEPTQLRPGLPQPGCVPPTPFMLAGGCFFLAYSGLEWLGEGGGGWKSVLDSDRRGGEGLLPEVMGEEACTRKGPPRAQPALAPSLMWGCPKAQPGPRLCGKRESRCRKAKLSVLRQVCSPPRFVMASSTLTCL